MNDRDLTIGIGNIQEVESFARDNKHYYDGFVYGFQRFADIQGREHNTIKTNIEMKLLFYLYMKNKNTISMSNSEFKIDKQLLIKILTTINHNYKFDLLKGINLQDNQTIKSLISPILQKLISNIIPLSASIQSGSLDTSSKIIDIENLLISDIENETIEQLTTSSQVKYGLNFSLVRKRRIKDIKDLYIKDIKDLTVYDFQYIKIY